MNVVRPGPASLITYAYRHNLLKLSSNSHHKTSSDEGRLENKKQVCSIYSCCHLLLMFSSLERYLAKKKGSQLVGLFKSGPSIKDRPSG